MIKFADKRWPFFLNLEIKSVLFAFCLALLASWFFLPPFWLALLLVFLSWQQWPRRGSFAFWLGLWQAWFFGSGLGSWALFYLLLVYLADWLWGKRKNASWSLS